jgi:hypothetical protein
VTRERPLIRISSGTGEVEERGAREWLESHSAAKNGRPTKFNRIGYLTKLRSS